MTMTRHFPALASFAGIRSRPTWRRLPGVLALSGALVGCLLSAADLPAPVENDASRSLPRPTARQSELLELGMGLFVHWSPSVYQSSENDNLQTKRDAINPDQFDAGQIVRAAQSCGAGYIIFVAKHVGGYCAWQTKTTDYSLVTSPWRAGKGDMVGDLAAACAKAGLKFGVYLCPRDDHAKIGNGGRAGRNQAQASAYYRAQLTELLTMYGPIFEVWFDGGAIIPVNDLLDQHAPGLVTFQGRRPGSTRWVGSEYGTAPYPCWSTVPWKEGELPPKGAGAPEGNVWATAECDVSILFPRWFWSPGSDARALSLERLTDIYYRSVGRSSVLLLNITPDQHGVVPEAQMQRLAEFGQDLASRFAKSVATTATVLAESVGSVVLPLGSGQAVDHVRIREDLRGGERVRRFRLEAQTGPDTWQTLYSGSQIGPRQIIPFPRVTAQALRLQILAAAAPPAFSEFAAFRIDRPVPKAAQRDGEQRPTKAPVVERSRDGLFSFTAGNPDWELHYTLDGSEPTLAAPIYREPQPLPQGGLLKARYFVPGTKPLLASPLLVRRLGLAASAVRVLPGGIEDPQATGALACDADPQTTWKTTGAFGRPPELILDLGAVRQITGIAVLSGRPNPAERIALQVAAERAEFPADPGPELKLAPVAQAAEWREGLVTGTPVIGRFVRLRFLPGAAADAALTIAEIELLVQP